MYFCRLIRVFSFVCLSSLFVHSNPIQSCPEFLSKQPIYSDIVTLSDVVSWNEGFEYIHGLNGIYSCIYDALGIYDTRVRVYENNNHDIFIVYRPTQQTYDGSLIHQERRLSSCTFMNGSCYGLVNDRFQQAFISLTTDDFLEKIRDKNVFIAGHSLGGSFTIFMGIYLTNVLHQFPRLILNLAGPFIGDANFYYFYQYPNFDTMTNSSFMIESVNLYNQNEFDGTVEGYNVDASPYLYIDQSKICGVTVPKLADSYGMHDLRNYKQFFKGS
jgi:hypothetical protein